MKRWEREIAHLREISELRFRLDDKARELQASEYNRRLEGLNHEAAQLKSMQERYIPRDTYGAEVGNLVKETGIMRVSFANLTGRIFAIASIISLAVSAVFLAVASHFIK